MRKIYRLGILLLALLPAVAMAGTVQLTGTLRSPSGDLFNGKIKIQFPYAGAVDTNCGSPSSCLIAPLVTTVTITNGIPPFSPPPLLTRNADINPSGTYYRAYIYDTYGSLLSTSNFIIPAGGSTFDIGAALQTSVTTQNVSYINPANLSGNNTWTGQNAFQFLTILASINGDGGGYKHIRGGSVCATAGSVGATCNNNMTWLTPFADTNYTVVCTGLGITSGVPAGGAITSKLAGTFSFATIAVTAAAAQFTQIDCMAAHD